MLFLFFIGDKKNCFIKLLVEHLRVVLNNKKICKRISINHKKKNEIEHKQSTLRWNIIIK